jgi:hypothetical protein
MTGQHDFDFLVGTWRVHHRRLAERLTGCTRWETFEGTCTMRTVLGGAGNIDDNVLDAPAGTYRAATVRTFDHGTGDWSIWWFDGRTPHQLEPPVVGRFRDGIGTFHAEDTLRGLPIRVRFVWSEITASACRWEQAFSPDGGTTWESNWEMQFERRPQPEAA